MAAIFLRSDGDSAGNVVVCGHPNTQCVSLRAVRYAAKNDGIGFAVELSLTAAAARELARELEREADSIADATDLPGNARVVDDSAGFEPETV